MIQRSIAQTSIYLCLMSQIQAISIVYNLKIAETTKRQAIQALYTHPSVAVLIPFERSAVLRGGIHQNAAGAIGTLIYSKQKFYMRMDFAAGHASTKGPTINVSKNQSDDILFAAGYSHDISDRTRFTISGILGVPTHKDTILQGVELGTGHVGLGAQADGSFLYTANQHHSFRAAARYIRFFERSISTKIAQECYYFKFNLGNLIDILIAHHSNWNKNALEVGYNPTFLFGARINPPLDNVTGETDFIRSSFYGAYARFFMIGKKHPSGVGLGFSYGFDHRPYLLGSKRIITAWVAWGVNF